MTLVDSAVRLLTIGQLLLIALVIGLGGAPRQIRLATVGLLVGIVAFLVLATPVHLDERGPVWALVELAAQAVPITLWVFAHLLFERRPDHRLLVGGILVLTSCWIGFGLADAHPAAGLWLGIIQRGISLVFAGHAVLIALSERGDDLIEKRRRLRIAFVIVVGSLAVMVLVIEAAFGFRHTSALVTLPQALAILVATMALGAGLLQSDSDILFDPAVAPTPDPPQPSRLSPAEHVLRQKLDTAMAGGVYRESGLTIGALAGRLGTPEHRLRALINQRLGYRNFSSYLNHHRIGAAKAMLADPAHVDVPILTIAMDLGYGSLAPFNRAFREDVGQAPSEFRRSRIVRN